MTRTAHATTVRVEAMRQHVLDICRQCEIQIEWRRSSRGGWAVHEFELVSIPPIKSAVTYAVALHEIGHVLGRHQRSRSRVVRERWAWVWARRHAITWTPAMEHTMRRALDWYEQRSWPPISASAELNPRICMPAKPEMTNVGVTDRESRLRRSLKRLGFDLVDADAGQFYIRHGGRVHANNELFGLSLDQVETWIRDRRTGYDQQRQE